MDQLRALKYFLSVAETGSFTQSAEAFQVPASSLSRRISDLEKILGATLLRRTTREVNLTEVGRDYYQQVAPLVRQLAESDDSVRSYHSEPMGTLRISTLQSFGERLLMPLMDEFNQLYPKVVLDVHLSDAVTTLDRDDIDIAIRGGYAPNDRVIATRLMDNNFIPLASPAYLECHGKPTSPVDLKQHKGLYFRTPAGPTPWLAKIDDQWQDVSAPPVAITNQGDWLLKKALNAEGILFVPRWVCAEYLQRQELVELAFDEDVNITPDQDFALYLLYQRHRYAVPKIKAAVDFIVQRMKQVN